MPSPPKSLSADLLRGRKALSLWRGWGPLLVCDWEMQGQACDTLHIGVTELEGEPGLPGTPEQSEEIGSDIGRHFRAQVGGLPSPSLSFHHL